MAGIIIAGGGATGTYLAAHFARSRADTLVLARGSRLARLQSDGAVVVRKGAAIRTPVIAVADCTGLPAAAAILLCTKAGDLRAVLDRLAPAVDDRTVFVTVQNGVDAPGIVAARFPGGQVIASRLHGFFEMASNAVHHVGVEPSLVLGPWPPSGMADRKSTRLNSSH